LKVETFDTAAAFLEALHGKPRQKRGRATRPELPAAGRAPSTGLTPLLVAGWNIEHQPAKGYRLYRGTLSTGWCEDEAAVCKAAKGLT
jgi:hypothetical protein